ncbi:phage holin family protein, partial [Paenibacillus larvae]
MERLDTALKTGVASVGGLTSFLFGGWPMLLQVLLVLVVVDYATGLMAARTQGKLESNVGLKGIARKVFIFFIVAVAHQIDLILGNQHM